MAAPKSEAATKRPPGRPTTYTEARGERICRVLANCTEPLQELCGEHPDFPEDPSTLYDWQATHEAFSQGYARAMRLRARLYMDESREIVDEVDPDEVGGIGSARVQKARLQSHVRHLFAKGLDPQTWGESHKHEVSGPGGEPVSVSFVDLARRAEES